MNFRFNFVGCSLAVLASLATCGAALAAIPAASANRAGNAEAAAVAAAAAAEQADTARRTVLMIDYIGIDYSGAIQDGRIISDLEYGEMQTFGGQLAPRLRELGIPAADPLQQAAEELSKAIDDKAPPERVAELASALSASVRQRFAVSALPPRLPSLENGARLFAQACTPCHGASGRGDGLFASHLEPKPADLTDRERMLTLRPATIFSTITYGIPDTAMASHAEAYDDAQRYDLTLYVASLAFTPEEVERGMALVTKDPSLLVERVRGLGALIERSANDLSGGTEDGTAIVAYARTHPEALRARSHSLELARRRMNESWEALGNGNAALAQELAVSAYLDGFEPVEPALTAVDETLRLRVEQNFLDYSQALTKGTPQDRQAAYDAITQALAETEEALSTDLGAGAAFAGAFAIVAREGFEAVLLVLALCSLLIRAGRREALRYVHAGWIAALAAGVATWLAARSLIELSGAEREIIEGVAALTASAILFYVSYWLIAKSAADRWQAYLRQRIHTALSRGNLWTLAFISFVAVYREVFETILFYQALWSQAGEGAGSAIFAGTGAGMAALLVLCVGGLRFGLKLPMGRFFTVSSVLLYALSVMLAGKGIAALQEAGYIGLTPVPFVRIESLGVHPTLEGLLAQGLLLAAAAVAAVVLRMRTPDDEVRAVASVGKTETGA
ncbi:MAG TPA: cytochrome c/FTR1 family iron permease [Candidatus Limnocylindrales bacterium]|nr:cytochrome c/FTR1 family iron permease [Candidatus Limnocylindrales bacterium]